VRLTDLVNTVSSSVREVTNFIRYPLQNISRIAMRRAQDEYEKIEPPFGKKSPEKEQPVRESKTRTLEATAIPREIKEKEKETATAVKIVETKRLVRRKSRGTEDIPILQKDQELRGRRGRYRIEGLLKDGERVRLYQGIHVVNSKPILIKEYLLPDRDFNKQEARERKDKFEGLASLNLKNGGGQDFRLVSPWDAIAPPNEKEKRCYLIIEPPMHNCITLREYLHRNGAMTPQQVRKVLDQVLQTLWFLHTQKLRISSDDVQQGLPHGNLSLDSLAIATNNQPTAFDEPQFFIYVSDLALWEDLFKSPTAKIINYAPEQDLKELGYVSFYLLSGTDVHPIYNQPLDPKIQEHWPDIKDNRLKKFIYRLLGIDPPFTTAFEARQALKAPLQEEMEALADVFTEPDEKSNNYAIGRLLLKILAFGLIAWFLWQIILFALKSFNTGQVKLPIISKSSEPCCLVEVERVPTSEITYTTEAEGVWSYVLSNFSLVSYGKTLDQELKARDPRLANYTFNTSTQDVIEEVRSGRANFALTSYIDKLPDDLQQEEVAYDGLVVFVAFSDNKREQSIPSALDGKITLNQLRELYTTGTLENWSPPAGINKEIKLYMPLDNPKAIKLFEQLVFKGETPNEFIDLKQKVIREAIEEKQKVSEGVVARINEQYDYKPGWQRQEIIEKARRSIYEKKIDESYILGEILKDFEQNQTVGIGFGLISRVFNQCAVYPLAVGRKGREVQALVQKVDGEIKPIEPTTDLCNDKGSYWPDVEAFDSDRYPLRYRLVVVYPKDEQRGEAGRKFAELMKTDEGQRLLREAGLVTLRNIPEGN
jgi:serine/threonine protein kinase